MNRWSRRIVPPLLFGVLGVGPGTGRAAGSGGPRPSLLAMPAPGEPGEARSARSPTATGSPCGWSNVLDPAVTDIGFAVGASWIDFDGDGDLDIYFTKGAGTGGPESRLVRNEGDGTFRLVPGSAVASPGEDRCPTWGDYDNDGDPDCYVTADGPHHLFRNDGAGVFTDVTTPDLTGSGNGSGCAWVDYDNDGDLDLYVASTSGPNQLFRNDGTGLVDVSAPPLNVTGPTQGVAWADYDNDGDQDLYLAVNAASNRLFRNDGGGRFADVSGPPVDDRGNSHGAAWGDYNNDGWLDLYVTNLGTPNKLFRNDGPGGFTDMSIFPLNDSQLSAGCAWGDYDNDGWLDLYFNRGFIPNVLLHNDLGFGEFHFTDVTEGPLAHVPLGSGLGWGDYDGDGDLDLLLATIQDDQPNRLVRNDCPPVRNWLHVDLRGILSNRSGVGARIRVVQGHLVQHREVNAGSGFFSQDSFTAEFGFGLASRSSEIVDTVEVRWPSGIRQTLTAVAPNRRIVVVEDTTTTALRVSGFRGVAQRNGVRLEWYASFDHRHDEFFVHRATSGSGLYRRLHDRPIRGANPHEYVDGDVEPGAVYFYRLEAVDPGGSRVMLEPIAVHVPPGPGRVARLEPAAPNPFGKSTELSFWLEAPGRARLTIYDVTGRYLTTIAEARFPLGRQSFLWDGRDAFGRPVSAGVYFCRLDAGGVSRVRPLVRVGR